MEEQDKLLVGDKFEISYGNLQTLKLIPEMMIYTKWRRELRKLALDYLSEKTLKNEKTN